MTERVDFWGNYADCVRKEGVPEAQVRWYLRWAEAFARAIRSVPLRERSIADVQTFLDDLKADEKIAPWQVEQARAAIGILYRKHLLLDPAHMPRTRKNAPKDTLAQPRQLNALHGEILEQTRTAIRTKHYSARTEAAYLGWIRRFIVFHDLQSPLELNETHIRDYLGYLATERSVASSTQNQALNALVFLYRNILNLELGDFSDFVRAKVPKRTPASLSREQVSALLDALEMPYLLMAMLMYGAGLRVTECLQLRIRDLDFDRATIRVYGKGAKERRVMFPVSCVEPLRHQLTASREIYEVDRVHDPGLREADCYVFPATALSVDKSTLSAVRGHMSRNGVQDALARGAARAGLSITVTPHMLRHAFAEHLVESGTHIQTIQELLGHARLSTTMIYTHPMNRPGSHPESPLSSMEDRADSRDGGDP